MPPRAPLLVALLVLAGVRDARPEDLAVIVHPGNPVASVSLADLREILLMERQHWSAGEKIYLLLPASGTPGKQELLKRVLRMRDADLKRHYLAKLYAGEISSFPRIAPSTEAAIRTVARAPNAIAIVSARGVDGSVKALSIDGLKPGESGYLLAATP